MVGFTSSKDKNVIQYNGSLILSIFTVKGQRSRSKAQTCWNRLLAVTPPQMVRFTSATDQNVAQRSVDCPIPGAGSLLCHELQIFFL